MTAYDLAADIDMRYARYLAGQSAYHEPVAITRAEFAARFMDFRARRLAETVRYLAGLEGRAARVRHGLAGVACDIRAESNRPDASADVIQPLLAERAERRYLLACILCDIRAARRTIAELEA